MTPLGREKQKSQQSHPSHQGARRTSMNDAQNRSKAAGGWGRCFALLAAVGAFGACAAADAPGAPGAPGAPNARGAPEGPTGARAAALELPETCGDDTDNDFDGLADCLDPDCSAVPACADKFACDGRALQFLGVSAATSRLAAINTSVPGLWTYALPFGTTQRLYNGCGLNTVDGFIYCVDQNTNGIVQIKRGVPLVETPVAGNIPDFGGSSAADFDLAGNFWVFQKPQLFKVDVNNVVAATKVNWPELNAADIAFNPKDGRLYGLNADGLKLAIFDTATSAQVAAKNVTGAPACVSYGAQWFDASGRLFVACSATGQLFRLDVTRAVPAAEPLVGSGAALISNGTDSATCPLARGLFELCGNGLDDDGDGQVDEAGVPNGCVVPDTDGDGVDDDDDLDDDNDGIPDELEPGDRDGDGVLDRLDLDGDADGLPDAFEAGHVASAAGATRACAGTPASVGANGLCDNVETAPDSGAINYTVRDTDGDGVRDHADLDSDNDGLNDVLEAGGVDVNGDGRLDALAPSAPDGDGDGLIDRADADTGGAPLAPADSDVDGRPDYRDLDSDNDARSDLVEGGSAGRDADDDGVVDGPDTDGDGIQDSVDGLATFGDAGSPAPPDNDAAMAPNTPDYLDPDSDGNGVFDIASTPNASLDANNDGRIDAPADADADGIADAVDEKPGVFGGLGVSPGPGPGGPDSDGDGLPDDAEGPLGSDPNDADSDDDGVPDGLEPNPGGDADGDGVPNVLDPDSDGDGIFDGTELGLGCGGPGVDPTKGQCIADADPSTKTDPLDPDTDDGSVSDGDEDTNHNGRIDPGERDPNVGADDTTCVGLVCVGDDGSLEGGGLSCSASPPGRGAAAGALGLALAALLAGARRKRAG